jgi:Outer membrane protein beta-barrel domain
MRTRLLVILAMSAACIAGGARHAAAQSSGAAHGEPRVDIAGTLGWFNLKDVDPNRRYDDWANKMADLGAGAGWYWTPNLRTQVDFGWTTKADRYSYEAFVIDGHQAYAQSETTLSSPHLAIAQHYQFFRNQWFHPRVGAGIDLTWEHRRVEAQPIVFFDPVSHQTVSLKPGAEEGSTTATFARPFFDVGYKAYMTPRAFFTNDLRLGVRHGGVDNVVLRFGFGVDF